MAQAFDNVDFRQFTVRQRIELIGEIWDSIENEELELTPQQAEELDRRLEDEEAHPNAGAPWEEVKRRIRGE